MYPLTYFIRLYVCLEMNVVILVFNIIHIQIQFKVIFHPRIDIILLECQTQ